MRVNKPRPCVCVDRHCCRWRDRVGLGRGRPGVPRRRASVALRAAAPAGRSAGEPGLIAPARWAVHAKVSDTVLRAARAEPFLRVDG